MNMNPPSRNAYRDGSDCHACDSEDEIQVRTACGGTTQLTPDTPCVTYQGECIYFCLPVCKADFLANPRQSCMAIRFPYLNSA